MVRRNLGLPHRLISKNFNCVIWVKFTQGNAQLFGGEIFLDFHPHPFDWLHVENSFSYVRATQNNRPENEKFLPFIPAPKYRGEIKTNFEKVNNTFSDFYAKFSVDHYFKQNNIYSAFDTETATLLTHF